jgi:putative membrane protein
MLRDRLALDRTLLANERTLLAYVRTALALMVTGASALHFLSGSAMRVLGLAALAIGILTGLFGLVRFQTMRSRIRRAG